MTLRCQWLLVSLWLGSCSGEAATVFADANADTVTAEDSGDGGESGDATLGAADDVGVPAASDTESELSDVTPPADDSAALSDAAAPGDASGDLSEPGDVTPDAPDATSLDTAADDASWDDTSSDTVQTGDTVETGGSAGQPTWTVSGGCATANTWQSPECEAVACAAGEQCVGAGKCVPSGVFWASETAEYAEAYAAVASREDGAFAVSWSAGSWFEGSQVVYLRVFPDGTAAGGPALAVATDEPDVFRAPSVTTMEDDSWLVLWRSEDLASDVLRFRARRFLADGSAAAADTFDVNTTPLSVNASLGSSNIVAPVVIRLRDDQLIMAWAGGGAATQLGVYTRLFDKTGVPITDDLLVSDPSLGTAAYSPAIARLPAGLALVVWQTGVPGTKGDQVLYGRTVSGNGALGPILPLSPGLQVYEALPAVTAYPTGEVLVMSKVGNNSNSTSSVDIRGQLFPAGIAVAVTALNGGMVQTLDHDSEGFYPGQAPVAAFSDERAFGVWQDQGGSIRDVWFKRHYRQFDVWDCERESAGGPWLPDEAGGRYLPALSVWEDNHAVVAFSTDVFGGTASRIAIRLLSY
jgi:hypothetical protein